MKRPLTGLLIAGAGMMAAVMTEQKSITIREGWRDYKEGDKVLLGCHLLSWARLAEITSVRHVLLNEVTERELNDDGFNTLGEAVEVLREWYPTICENSPVTVIRWRLL